MDKIIYTIGYGNQKPEDFLKRLKDAKIDVVHDIRRPGSLSWCNSYHEGEVMRNFFEDKCPEIDYRNNSNLGNRFDELSAYKEWLETDKAQRILYYSSMNIAEGKAGKRPCLLCSERDAKKSVLMRDYKPGMEFPANCHRVYVAEALVKMLGDGWEVIHL